MNTNKVANYVEIAVPEAIRQLGWLGDNVKVIRTSEYDDLFNGVDSVVQMVPKSIVENVTDLKTIGFSIDFTISPEGAGIKAFNLAVSIAEGKIPLVKYFSTDIMTKEGITKNVKIRDFKIPKIIMSCSNQVLRRSQADLLKFEENPGDAEAKENAQDTVLRYHFIRQTLKQLEFFIGVAKEFGNTGAESLYQGSLESFKGIIAGLGITNEVLNEKLSGIKGGTEDFDLHANNGQYIEWVKAAMKK